MSTPYTVDHFITKFRGIPLKQWTTGVLLTIHGRCCALGHCGVRLGPAGKGFVWTREGRDLKALFKNDGIGANGSVTNVNDYALKEYPQRTPRARILAALRDIKKAQEAS